MTDEEESAPGIDVRPRGEIEERFLSPQADRFAGAKREKKSACLVRNDVVGGRIDKSWVTGAAGGGAAVNRGAGRTAWGATRMQRRFARMAANLGVSCI